MVGSLLARLETLRDRVERQINIDKLIHDQR